MCACTPAESGDNLVEQCQVEKSHLCVTCLIFFLCIYIKNLQVMSQ